MDSSSSALPAVHTLATGRLSYSAYLYGIARPLGPRLYGVIVDDMEVSSGTCTQSYDLAHRVQAVYFEPARKTAGNATEDIPDDDTR
jgi:hypothetical protein